MLKSLLSPKLSRKLKSSHRCKNMIFKSIGTSGHRLGTRTGAGVTLGQSFFLIVVQGSMDTGAAAAYEHPATDVHGSMAATKKPLHWRVGDTTSCPGIVLYCVDGVVIAAQCSANFLSSTVLPGIQILLGREYAN